MNNGMTLRKRMFKAFHNTPDRFYWKVRPDRVEHLLPTGGLAALKEPRDPPRYMGLDLIVVENLSDDFELVRIDMTTRKGVLDHYIWKVDQIKQAFRSRFDAAKTPEQFGKVAKACREQILHDTKPLAVLLEMLPMDAVEVTQP